METETENKKKKTEFQRSCVKAGCLATQKHTRVSLFGICQMFWKRKKIMDPGIHT